MRATPNEYSDSWLETLFPPSPLIPWRLAPENLYPDTAAQLSPILTGFLIPARTFRELLGSAIFWPMQHSEAKFAKNRCDFWMLPVPLARKFVVAPPGSKRHPLGTRKTKHVTFAESGRETDRLMSASDFFQKTI
jgi:hypothetical protein